MDFENSSDLGETRSTGNNVHGQNVVSERGESTETSVAVRPQDDTSSSGTTTSTTPTAQDGHLPTADTTLSHSSPLQHDDSTQTADNVSHHPSSASQNPTRATTTTGSPAQAIMQQQGYQILSIWPGPYLLVQQPVSIVNGVPTLAAYPMIQQNTMIVPTNNQQQSMMMPTIMVSGLSVAPIPNQQQQQQQQQQQPNQSRDSSSPAVASTVAASIPLQPQVSPSLSSKQYTLLSLNLDEEYLSPYQCLVRKQIELFVATQDYVAESHQGRNRPICLGQVGIRCRHCGRLPPDRRAKGSVYFPSRLFGLYQTAQNMANAHLVKDCTQIPPELRRKLLDLREAAKGKSSHGGGRQYWAQGLRAVGVVETSDRRLRIRDDDSRPR